MAKKRKGTNPRKKARKVKTNSKNDNGNNTNRLTTAGNHTRSNTETSVLVSDTQSQIHTSSKAGASGWSRAALVPGSRTGKMPHPWFKKWGWWFAPLALIGVALSAWWGVRHIEGQVLAAAPGILQAADVEPSGLTFDADYRNIEVGGQLPQGVTADEVVKILETGTGADNEDIRFATVTAQEAPAPEPEAPAEPEPAPVVEPTGEISVAAVADGQTITLSGSVPNQAHADKLLSAATQAVGEDNVVNQLNVLGLAPSAEQPEIQINRLAQVLPLLGSGVSAANLALGDDTFNGSIDAVDDSAKDRLDPIAATTSNNEVAVTAPAIVAEVESLEIDVFTNYRDNKIFLYGEVMNEAQSQTLINAATESVGEDNVLSTLTWLKTDSTSTASDSQIALLGEALRRYNGLRSAESRLNESKLYLRGVARDDAGKETIDQSLQSRTDDDLTVDSKISLLSAEREVLLLQEELDQLASEIRENVVFASNSDVLDTRANQVLNKVADAMDKYQRPRVEISGHTDSTGSADKNQALSARRATAVQAYLTAQGINVERLQPIGAGESQPIGDNNTQAGRQQNRRVEFTAVQRF